MTTRTHVPSSPTAPRVPSDGLPRPLPALAAALGLASAVLGSWLLAHPASALARDPEVFLVRVVLGLRATALLVVALGAVAAVSALATLAVRRAPARRRPRPWLLGVALVQLLGFGVALQSVTTISLAGYLAAAAVLPALLVLLTVVVRRHRVLRWPVLAVLTAALGAVVWRWEPVAAALSRLGAGLARGFVASAPRFGVAVLAAGVVAVWLLVAVRLVRGSEGLRAASGWVLRHRRSITLVAAAGPLPYGLVRLTWLTPWPVLAPDSSLPPEVRLWGLLLGGAALAGTVLTLGLLLPWGETVPRWFPGGAAGRPVPVTAAVVPGGLVAGLVSAAALPMLRLALAPAPDEVSGGLSLLERLELTLLFPFWLWGPALALAVWGYAQHRARTARAERLGG